MAKYSLPELDQLPAGADEPESKPFADVVGYSTDDPVGHADSGNLVTRRGPV